jgi:type IV secretory pathway TraG/TraD family ATPase VirD4
MPLWVYIVMSIILGLIVLGVGLSLVHVIIRGVLWCIYLLPSVARRVWAMLTGTTPTGHGSAHLATLAEIEGKGLFNHEGIPLGRFDGRTLREPFGGHVALIGPPRSRKSWGLIMPAIEGWNGSLIVNDMRGELFERTASTRRLKGPVARFDPSGKDSIPLNVCDLVRWGEDQQYGDVQRLVHGLLSPDPGEPWDSWRLEAEPLLVSLILDRQADGEGSLPAVVRWMTEPSRSRAEKLKSLLRSPLPTVQAGARRILDNSERQAGVVWGTVLSALNIYLDPVVAEHTAHSDLDLRDLQDGTRPLSLYLTPSFADASRLRPLLATVIEMVVARMSQPRTDAPRQRVLLCLDETMNLGRLDGLEKGMSYLEGCHVQALLTFQNIQQWRHVYGRESPLLASIATSVYYTPTPSDTETATYLSEQLGVATAVRATMSESVSVWGFLQRTTYGQQQHARPLRTPDELQRMDEHTAMVLVKGLAPIEARKLDAPEPVTLTNVSHRYRKPIAAGIAAALLFATSYGIWKVQHTPTPPPVALSLTPMPTTPQPEAPPAKAIPFRPFPLPQVKEGKGWALWSYELGAFGGVAPYAPVRHHASIEACEADKRSRIEQMGSYLATVMAAHPAQVTMTDHGWTQGHDQPMPKGLGTWGTARETLLLCAVWTPDS